MTIAENNELGDRCRYLTRKRRALQEMLNNLSEDDPDFENKRRNLQKNIDGIWMEEKDISCKLTVPHEPVSFDVPIEHKPKRDYMGMQDPNSYAERVARAQAEERENVLPTQWYGMD